MMFPSITFNGVLKCMVILAFSGAALLGSARAASLEEEPQAPFEVRVTGSRVNVRARPTTESEVLFQVTRGETLHLVEDAGAWYLIETPDATQGYIFGKLVEPIELPPSWNEPSAYETSTATNTEPVFPTDTSSREKSRKGLYKLAGGAASIITGFATIGSSKPIGIGLFGAGGYLAWTGYKDRKEARRGMEWSVIVQIDRDSKGVAYYMSW